MNCLKILGFTLMYVWSASLWSQERTQLENFKGLMSSGALPGDFQRNWADRYEETMKESLGNQGNKKAARVFEGFWQKEYRYIDEMYQSGWLSFGDPLSIYLNHIADTLLREQNELREKIQIYTFKSPSVNAFCSAEGLIGVNIGLFAHAKSEAELAYVLAHEISHYTQHHAYDSYEQKKALYRSSMNHIKRFDEITTRSQDNELDADRHGVDMYLRSPYHPEAVNEAFTTLHQSYISYGRTSVGKDFLSAPGFTLPDVFYRPVLNPISKEEDYFDQTHSHPNISTRRKVVKSKLRSSPGENKKFFLQPESAFYELRDLARFEAVREKVLYRRYAEALYDIYVLEQQYPGNKFLEISKIRVLFGLAGFKAVDKVSEVVKSSINVEGPSQQVFHLIKQLNSRQLVSIALYHTLKAREKYPDEEIFDKYVTALYRYLLAYCKMAPEDFAAEEDSTGVFDKTVEDYSSEKHFLRARQMYHEDFYRRLFRAEYESGRLRENMEKHRPFRDSINAENYLTVDEREERAEEKEERLEEHGADLHIRKMIVLDPSIYVVNGSEKVKKQLKELEKEEEYKSMLPHWIREAGIEPVLLYLKEMDKKNADDYNRFSALKEWTTEAGMFGEHDIVPTGLDISKTIGATTRYVCRIFGHIDKKGKDFYYFGIYDLKKGEVVYKRREKAGRNLSISDLEKETKTDLKRIYH